MFTVIMGEKYMIITHCRFYAYQKDCYNLGISRNHEKLLFRSTPMISHVLVATDGSPHANRAVDFAVDLATRYNARMSIVYVVTSGKVSESLRHMAEVEHILDSGSKGNHPATTTFPSQLMTELGGSGEKSRTALTKIGDFLVEKAAKKAKSKSIKNIKTYVENGDAAETVLEIAKDNDVDAIITGSRGLGNLSTLLLGSVSYKINQLAECTCMNVK